MATTKNGNDTPNPEQLTSEYFESIKGNPAALRQFFSAMPKGGDVHNHLTGSAYAETYFELAAKKGMYVNPETGRLYAQKPMEVETIQLSKDMDDLHNHRMALIDKWSIRNFQPYKYPLGPDEYFFGTFAYGIDISRSGSVRSSNFWLAGDGTWPVLHFTRNTLNN